MSGFRLACQAITSGEGRRDVLDGLGERAGAVHLEEFAAAQRGGADTTEMGRGPVPLGDAPTWIRSNLHGTWLVAEQDSASVPPAEAAGAGARCLRARP